MHDQITVSSTNGIKEFIRNSKVEIKLDGWPATVAISVGFLSVAAIYGIKLCNKK